MSRESDFSMRNRKIIYDFMILIFNRLNSCAHFWKTLSKAPGPNPFFVLKDALVEFKGSFSHFFFAQFES